MSSTNGICQSDSQVANDLGELVDSSPAGRYGSEMRQVNCPRERLIASLTLLCARKRNR